MEKLLRVMNKRDELAQAVASKIHSKEPLRMDYVIVDAILESLINPGEIAKLEGARSIGKTINYTNQIERANECWQIMLKRISSKS